MHVGKTGLIVARMLRPVNKHRLTIPKQLPIIWLQQPIGNFYEGGFAGTIFSQKCVNFTSVDAERHVIIRNEVSKTFGNANSFKKWSRF